MNRFIEQRLDAAPDDDVKGVAKQVVEMAAVLRGQALEDYVSNLLRATIRKRGSNT
jgi:hypothetical protein